jgi:hypothetical protein
MSADRAASRAALKVLLETITTFEIVYNGAPFNTGGLSPVAMVTSDGTETGPGETFTTTATAHRILIDLLWLRVATTEADIDALSAVVFALLKANRYANATWTSMEIDGRSQLDYVLIDGKDYRLERIPVVVW